VRRSISRHMTLQIAIWRAFPAIFASKGAPVLEFSFLIPAFLRACFPHFHGLASVD